MGEMIVVLTELTLKPEDLRNLETVRGAGDDSVLLLVPEDTHRNLLVDFLDNLSLLELSRAVRDLGRGQPDPVEARTSAARILADSLALLREAGWQAEGRTVDDNPVPPLVDAVRETQAGRVVVITEPHAVEDTFHFDWANQAQDRLGVPVLHLYSGTAFIGDS